MKIPRIPSKLFGKSLTIDFAGENNLHAKLLTESGPVAIEGKDLDEIFYRAVQNIPDEASHFDDKKALDILSKNLQDHPAVKGCLHLKLARYSPSELTVRVPWDSVDYPVARYHESYGYSNKEQRFYCHLLDYEYPKVVDQIALYCEKAYHQRFSVSLAKRLVQALFIEGLNKAINLPEEEKGMLTWKTVKPSSKALLKYLEGDEEFRKKVLSYASNLIYHMHQMCS